MAVTFAVQPDHISCITSSRPNSGCSFLLPFPQFVLEGVQFSVLGFFSFDPQSGHRDFWGEFTHFRHKMINCLRYLLPLAQHISRFPHVFITCTLAWLRSISFLGFFEHIALLL